MQNTRGGFYCVDKKGLSPFARWHNKTDNRERTIEPSPCAFRNSKFERTLVMCPDGSTKSEYIPQFIALAHELIHAKNNMEGLMIYYDENTRKGYARYQYVDKDTFLGKGKLKEALAPIEELITVGIPFSHLNGTRIFGNYRITENSIREEHGLLKRVKY